MNLNLGNYHVIVFINFRMRWLFLCIDRMLLKMWDYLGLIRIYTKKRGQPPDLSEPIVLSSEREGLSVDAVCKSISKDLLDKFNFAFVW